MITDGENGLFVPQGDVSAIVGAIKKITSNNTLAQRLLVAGKQRVSQFSDERMLRDLLKIIDSVSR